MLFGAFIYNYEWARRLFFLLLLFFFFLWFLVFNGGMYEVGSFLMLEIVLWSGWGWTRGWGVGWRGWVGGEWGGDNWDLGKGRYSVFFGFCLFFICGFILVLNMFVFFLIVDFLRFVFLFILFFCWYGFLWGGVGWRWAEKVGRMLLCVYLMCLEGWVWCWDVGGDGCAVLVLGVSYSY